MDAEDAMAKDIVAARIGRSKRARVVMAAPFKSRKIQNSARQNVSSRPVDSDGRTFFVAPDARDAVYDSPRLPSNRGARSRRVRRARAVRAIPRLISAFACSRRRRTRAIHPVRCPCCRRPWVRTTAEARARRPRARARDPTPPPNPRRPTPRSAAKGRADAADARVRSCPRARAIRVSASGARGFDSRRRPDWRSRAQRVRRARHLRQRRARRSGRETPAAAATASCSQLRLMQQIAHERLLLGFETILGRVPVLEGRVAARQTSRYPRRRHPRARGRRRHGRSRRDVLILSRATKQRRHLFRLERPRGRARGSLGELVPVLPVAPRGRRSERHAFDEGSLGRTSSAKTPPRRAGGRLLFSRFPRARVLSPAIPTSVARGFGLLLQRLPDSRVARGASSRFPRARVRPRAPAIASPRAATAARAPRSVRVRRPPAASARILGSDLSTTTSSTAAASETRARAPPTRRARRPFPGGESSPPRATAPRARPGDVPQRNQRAVRENRRRARVAHEVSRRLHVTAAVAPPARDARARTLNSTMNEAAAVGGMAAMPRLSHTRLAAPTGAGAGRISSAPRVARRHARTATKGDARAARERVGETYAKRARVHRGAS